MKTHFMKLVLGLFFTLFGCISINAQEYQYIPIVKAGLQIWTNDRGYYGQDDYNFLRYALTDEDTIIGNETYKKLYEFSGSNFDSTTSPCIGGIRENAQKQVYFKDGSSTSRLLYDFSLSVGDTFYIPNSTYTFEVNSIDTINYQGIQRRKLTIGILDDPFSRIIAQWIEGIGNYEGLLFDMEIRTTTAEVWSQIRCYEYNGELLYHNYSHGVAEDCITPLVGLNDIEKQSIDIDIYPNPAKENITFSCPSNIETIDIYNIMGKRVCEVEAKANLKTIDISSFNNGIYMAKIYTKQGVITKKFIVE